MVLEGKLASVLLFSSSSSLRRKTPITLFRVFYICGHTAYDCAENRGGMKLGNCLTCGTIFFWLGGGDHFYLPDGL